MAEQPRLSGPVVLRRVVAAIALAAALAGGAVAGAPSAGAADAAQTGTCTATGTRFDFAVFMDNAPGGVIPRLGVVISNPASQFRWVVHEYQVLPGGTLVLRRSWLDDPPGVAPADDLAMGGGFVVPADQIVFKVGAAKAKADGTNGGWCSTFTG
jgi:hypothetical protein